VSSFSPGVYMVKVIREGKAVLTKTFNKAN